MAGFCSLEGRIACVTGAGRGIGRAIAEELARAGAAVALVGRQPGPLGEVAAAIEAAGRRALVCPADVSDLAQVQAMAARIEFGLGPVDILVNNAGIYLAGPLETIELQAWEEVLRTNLTGAFLCIKALAPAMARRRWGRIVNISSIAAQTGGVAGSAAYSASKGGMLAMTRTLARDLAPHGVTVNAITPGQIETEMSAGLTPEARARLEAQIPLGRLGTSAEIAYAVRFLCSEEASYITGATLDVNGGILKR